MQRAATLIMSENTCIHFMIEGIMRVTPEGAGRLYFLPFEFLASL